MSNWEDIFNFNDQLTEEERLIQSSTNEYCQKSLMPRILEANRSESFDKEIYKELGSLGLLGALLMDTVVRALIMFLMGLLLERSKEWIQVTGLHIAFKLL